MFLQEAKTVRNRLDGVDGAAATLKRSPVLGKTRLPQRGAFFITEEAGQEFGLRLGEK